MNKLDKNQAFTLLELIIVIIIVGVLASLALPRFFRVIEYSRCTEALVNIQVIRQAVERCYMMGGGSNVNCLGTNAGGNINFDQLGVNDPGFSPNAHFDYHGLRTPGSDRFEIWALRNTRDGGDATNTITCWYNSGNSNFCVGAGIYTGNFGSGP